MKMKLVFPPVWDIKSPYPSIPCLDAYLKKQGEDVEQFDMNLEVFDHILSSDYLYECLMEAKGKGLSNKKAELLEYLADNVDACKETIRSEAATDPALYKSCWAFINVCISALADIWDGERISFGRYKLEGYDANNSTDVIRAVTDVMSEKAHSRLADIMRGFVREIVSDSDIIGLSVSHSEQIIPAMLIGALCKDVKPEIKIVMGGSLVSRWSLTPEVLKGFFHIIDFFSFFEGEKSLAALMQYMKSEIAIEQVPSLGYLQGDEVVINPTAESISMDALPTPVYDKKYLNRYLSPVPVLTLFSCRGCYWNRCAFCDHAAVYQDCFRTRSIDLIVSDIEFCMKEYGTRYFAFNDEAITAPVLKKLSKEIIERKLDIRWRNDARFDKAMDKEALELAYKAGLRILFYGLESYNERVISLMNKGIKLEWVEPIIKASSEAGIWNHVYIISGFPTETEDEFKDTCDFVERNSKYIDSVCLTPFGCGRFSDVARNPQKYNVTILHNPDKELSTLCQATMNDSDENITFGKRFNIGKEVSADGNEFLDIYSHTAAVIFSDYIINASRRKHNSEESMLSLGTPLYSKSGKVTFVVKNSNDKVRYVKVSGQVASIVEIVNKYVFKEDVLKSISERFGYPVEVAEIMLNQVKIVLGE